MCRRKTFVALLYQERSLLNLTCARIIAQCVAGLWYVTLPELRFGSPLQQSFLFTTSVVMLESGRYWNRLVRGACDWFPILQRDTYLSSPSHHLQSQWWFGIIFITPHIPGGLNCLCVLLSCSVAVYRIFRAVQLTVSGMLLIFQVKYIMRSLLKPFIIRSLRSWDKR